MMLNFHEYRGLSVVDGVCLGGRPEAKARNMAQSPVKHKKTV